MDVKQGSCNLVGGEWEHITSVLQVVNTCDIPDRRMFDRRISLPT
jgi:hypothetical protein